MEFGRCILWDLATFILTHNSIISCRVYDKSNTNIAGWYVTNLSTQYIWKIIPHSLDWSGLKQVWNNSTSGKPIEVDTYTSPGARLTNSFSIEFYGDGKFVSLSPRL